MLGHRPVDPYAVLGVPRDASPLQVARAHRRLAKRFHPDRGADGDADRMRRINEAWHILSEPARRSAYDREHPGAGLPAAGHWTASRTTIRATSPSTTRSWASWRASADETRAAPRTRSMRGPAAREPAAEGRPMAGVYRRPVMATTERGTFRDSVWAAVVMGAVMVLLLIAAVAINRLG